MIHREDIERRHNDFDRHFKRTEDMVHSSFRLAKVGAVVSILMQITVLVLGIWATAHFVSKYW